MLKRFHGRCGYCGIAHAELTVDHVVPTSKGGGNALSNLMPACLDCNRLKGNLTVEEFRARLANLPQPGRNLELDVGLKFGPFVPTRSAVVFLFEV